MTMSIHGETYVCRLVIKRRQGDGSQIPSSHTHNMSSVVAKKCSSGGHPQRE